MISIRRLALAALFLFALCRGLSLSVLQMPFNGWDEYNHLGTAAHVAEQGGMPNLSSPLPRSLFPFIVAHPHPPNSAAACAALGARRYPGLGPDTYVEPLRVPPGLYEAQQGPLYYELLARLRLVETGQWADLARALNCLFWAASIALWPGLLGRFLPRAPVFVWGIPWLLALSPLAGIAAARVGNDALSLFLGTAALAWAARYADTPGVFSRILHGAAAGALLGLAVLAKALALALLPVLLVLLAVRREALLRPRLGGAVAALCGYVLAAGPFHAASLRDHGCLTPTLASILNREQGRGWKELLAGAPKLWEARKCRRELKNGLLYGFSHGGGWAELPENGTDHAFKLLVRCGLTALPLALLFAAGRRRLREALAGGWILALLEFSFVGAFVYYGLQCLPVFNQNPMAEPWYALPALPGLLFLLALGLWALHPRLGVAWIGLTAACFLAGHFLSIRELLEVQSGLSGSEAFWQALRSHAGFRVLPGGGIEFLVGEGLALLFGAGWALRAVREGEAA